MKRSMIGSLTLLGLISVLSSGYAADDDVSVKAIMHKINGEDKVDGQLTIVKDQLKKKDKADWDKIGTAAKQITPLAEMLGKAKPAKGDEKSWEKFTKAYAESAKALEAAAEKKDLDTAQTALKQGLNNCGPCHKAHKGK